MNRFKTDICEHFINQECRYKKSQCRYAHGFYDLRIPYANGVAIQGYNKDIYVKKKDFEDLLNMKLRCIFNYINSC